jgi:hypothetical protein
MYIILEGKVEVSSSSRSKTMGILRVFGQLEMVFDLGDRKEKVVCLTDCKLMRISESSLMKIFNGK